jgi:alkaline phosphatase D
MDRIATLKAGGTTMTTRYDRRRFLASAAAMGAVLAWPSAQARPRRWPQKWNERRDLYAEGVASGDPAPDSVILWTRRQTDGPLFVEVARDEGFFSIVSHAQVTPRAENDWTVRVLAAGLTPSTTYWYRFSDASGAGSRIGRTRTAPAADDTRPVSFAFVSCQNQTLGANNAYRRMIFEDAQKPDSEQLGFVLHLGDFFYELVWYPEDRKTYYARTVREVVRYPKGEKHDDYHVPVDVDDYRAIFRAYLSDPDLADARARFAFVCIWDNHEFSWKGWQSLEDYGKGAFPAQTRKVAAGRAWFEFQPARIVKPGGDWNRYDAPHVSDTAIATFDDHGLGQEKNNLAAIDALKLYRSFAYGRNVDLVITDNRSYRSQEVTHQPEADAFDDKNFQGFPLEALEILDAGRAYNNGNPPATIRFAGKDIPNWRKDQPPSSILGAAQKRWFLETLGKSRAPWKLWGNTIGSLDARIDFQNLPKSAAATWPGASYAMLTDDDWSGYRQERGEILDFVKASKITGFASLAGDRHAFFAGLMSKALPPAAFEPVGVEFVTGSISAPGFGEALKYRMTQMQTQPMAAAYVTAQGEPAVNFAALHGVRAAFALGEGEHAARAKSDASVAPHLSFLDWAGHGYTVVRATGDTLEAEFVCIPPPIARAPGEDGGPLRYRVRHACALWKAGEPPAMTQTIVEGTPTLSV